MSISLIILPHRCVATHTDPPSPHVVNMYTLPSLVPPFYSLCGPYSLTTSVLKVWTDMPGPPQYLVSDRAETE